MPTIARLSWLMFASAVVAGAADQELVQYWNGKHRVVLALALDELDVVAGDGVAVERLQRAVPGATVAAAAKRSLLRFAGTDRAALAQRIAAARAAGAAPRIVLYPDPDRRTADERQVLTDRLAVRLPPGQDIAPLVAKYGLKIEERVTYSPDTWIAQITMPGVTAALDIANRIYETDGAVFATPLIERAVSLKGTPPGEPLFPQQWHLRNDVQFGSGNAGNDLNVVPVWDFTNGIGLGTGINIAVVDSGVQVAHPDLAVNCRTLIDVNLAGGSSGDPSPQSNAEYHGTAVAGIAAARDNGIGGVGVAPRAGIVGVRLTPGGFDASREAQAATWQMNPATVADRVHVNTNSWGPFDDGITLQAPDVLAVSARATGTTTGRGGKGIVYVWAAGNGDANGDEANYDGYANSPYVIAVAASAPDGYAASYSEGGACVFVEAPGGDGGGAGIVTTDMTGLGGSVSGDYFALGDNLAGTSFSAPAVAGVVALMLEANPLLGWRDVKHLFARTAIKPLNALAIVWIDNAASPSRHWSRYHGFGRVDANAAVTAARTWINAPVEATPLTGTGTVPGGGAIPNNNATGLTGSCTIAAPANFRAEVVEIHINITHNLRGQLRFVLTSPLGTPVDIGARPLDTGSDYDWTFTSVTSWGENPAGNWTLQVIDTSAAISGTKNGIGTWNNWSMTVHGYVPHPTPTMSGASPFGAATGSGATTVTITGTGFVADVSQVKWDGVVLASSVVSATQITVLVPAPNLAANGVHTFTVTNPDFDGGADHVSGGLTFRVSAPPSFTSAPSGNQPMTEDIARAFPIGVTDPDAGDVLTVTASTDNSVLFPVSGVVVTGAGNSRTLTLTPFPEAFGSANVTVTLSDGATAVTTSFSVTVAWANDPPVAFDGTFEARANLAFTGFLTGFDPDVGQVLTATINSGPSNGTLTNFVASTGAFTYTPTPGFTGLDSFTWHLTDNFSSPASSTTARATMVVMADPSLPRPRITTEPDDEVIAAGVAWSYDVNVDLRAYIITPGVSFELIGAPAGMTISASTGVISWSNPQPPAGGTHVSVIVLVKDNTVAGAVDYQQFLLRVVSSGALN